MKLKMKGLGNDDGRSWFILEKKNEFYSLFAKFLIDCGFQDLGLYEEYQEATQDISAITNKVEHFQNDAYDIDVIYAESSIVLIVRTAERDALNTGIAKMAEMS